MNRGVNVHVCVQDGRPHAAAGVDRGACAYVHVCVQDGRPHAAAGRGAELDGHARLCMHDTYVYTCTHMRMQDVVQSSTAMLAKASNDGVKNCAHRLVCACGHVHID